MFNLSAKTDYAVKAVLDLSHRYGEETVPLTDIAERAGIPLKYLEQIMLIIKKAGLVDSRRGLGGGFSLIKKPEEITLGGVMRAVAGDGHSRQIDKHNANYADEQALEEIWQQVTQAMSEIIDRVTFADIMRRAEELRSENSEFNFVI